MKKWKSNKKRINKTLNSISLNAIFLMLHSLSLVKNKKAICFNQQKNSPSFDGEQLMFI